MTEAQAYDTDVFVDMIEAFRELQATLCLVAPPPGATTELTAAIADVTNRLKEFEAPEGARPARDLGMRGIAHPVLVPYQSYDTSDKKLVGTVRFSYAHMGGGGAAHGGVITMLFDDLLGTFVSRRAQLGSRTAYLKVDFRNVTPVHCDLRIDASIDRIEGRKTFVTGTILNGDVVCATAEALFIRLLPGQP
ncbi:acyl-coenzyme A thioesterase PaaI-like protein [Williamsia muralis]|uniref:Acyl-coenzyme A thioesterase THEM4 n=1 Tax=Williamsia marianensis TaxID=85044 RepID=A0A495K8C1_WILMA|nr:hotdog domain-containing protein [Williamsia muralis]RKR97556.1 acyl-coenzyme A thioesterase PaaI-like protein [Williamsia muralis]